MRRRELLVAVSTVQLLAGAAGQALAVRRRLAFDIAVLHWSGRRDRVARDSLLLGTGLSAPVVMLVVQGAAVARLARGPSRDATRVLGALGAAMIGGYLVEREVRAALRPAGWDPAVTPVALLGAGLSVAMARLGLARATAP